VRLDLWLLDLGRFDDNWLRLGDLLGEVASLGLAAGGPGGHGFESSWSLAHVGWDVLSGDELHLELGVFGCLSLEIQKTVIGFACFVLSLSKFFGLEEGLLQIFSGRIFSLDLDNYHVDLIKGRIGGLSLEMTESTDLWPLVQAVATNCIVRGTG
jgi:hypothetical protein